MLTATTVPTPTQDDPATLEQILDAITALGIRIDDIEETLERIDSHVCDIAVDSGTGFSIEGE